MKNAVSADDDPFERLNRVTRVEDIPMPASLRVIDEHYHTLNLPLFVVGPSAKLFLSAVHEQTSEPAGRRVVSLTRPGEPTWSLLPLRLGRIRGWTPTLYLYCICDDPRLIPKLEKHGKDARGFVVAGPSPTEFDPVFLAVARLISSNATVPFAVFGPAPLAEKLSVLTDRQPVAVIAPLAENALRVLKEITRPILDSIVSGA